MFEKEAYEYGKAKIDLATSMMNPNIETATRQGFKDGAEFGYNKAKEEIEKLKELVSDCLFYCDHIDPYYNECLTEDNIFERAEKLGVKYE